MTFKYEIVATIQCILRQKNDSEKQVLVMKTAELATTTAKSLADVVLANAVVTLKFEVADIATRRPRKKGSEKQALQALAVKMQNWIS